MTPYDPEEQWDDLCIHMAQDDKEVVMNESITISEALYEELIAVCLRAMDVAKQMVYLDPGDADTILSGNASLVRAVMRGDEVSPGAGKCIRCRDLVEWSGDAPLPYPIVLGTKGLVEHHCGHSGGNYPRFTYICPDCDFKEAT